MTTLLCSLASARRWVMFTVVSLAVAIPAIAQQPVVSSPLSADEVVERLVAMNRARAAKLTSYSDLRTYHLECHCLSHKTADMVVRIEYQAPDKKTFKIVSESGSGTVRDRVFKKLLEAEQDSMEADIQQRSAITPENYTFTLLDYKRSDAGDVYVLDAQPRTKNKYLFRGHIWVDGREFAITRIQGQPAVNPSWWTERTDFTRTYEKIGEFWLPKSNESDTKVRAFGTAKLSIDFGDYQIVSPGSIMTAVDRQRAQNQNTN